MPVPPLVECASTEYEPRNVWSAATATRRHVI